MSPGRIASLKTTFLGCHEHLRRVARTSVGNCSVSESEQSGDSQDALSGMVDARVEKLLGREENRGLLDGLERTSQRVAEARRELAEIERREAEARADEELHRTAQDQSF